MTDFQEQFQALFNDHPELTILLKHIQTGSTPAWFAGGVIRDLLLQRPVIDVDVVTAGDPTSLAKTWASETSGRWFWLDPERRQSRVLLRQGLTVDFVPLRAATIAEDQQLRDYTINSMAVSLEAPSAQAKLLDPLKGVEDLMSNQLVLCSGQSIPDDPLRMLKGIRHLAVLGLALSPETSAQMQTHSRLIREVAGERIRDEIGKILAADNCFNALSVLLDTGLLAALFGPAGPGWNQNLALKKLVFLEQQINSFMLEASPEKEEPERQEIFPQRSLFLLSALLKEYQPTNIAELLHNRMRLSRQQQRLIMALQLEPSAEWLHKAITSRKPRQQALIVEQLGYAPDEQLLYLAIEQNELSFKRALLLVDAYLQNQRFGRVPDLLNGNAIIEVLSDCPEHELNLWQKRIKAAEIAGEVETIKDVASWLLKQKNL